MEKSTLKLSSQDELRHLVTVSLFALAIGNLTHSDIESTKEVSIYFRTVFPNQGEDMPSQAANHDMAPLMVLLTLYLGGFIAEVH